MVAGWYADPEARFYEGKYWIYVTRSATDYKKQTNLDAFSSVDGIRWTKHEGIIRMEDFPYVTPVSYTHLDVYKRQLYRKL